MTSSLDGLPEAAKWRLMVEAAKQGAISQGYALERVPGRGLSNIYTITKNGKSQRASIRTTRDRWFAFPPMAKGTKWKTLSDVDVVIVAAVDSRDNARNAEIFIFPADEVRSRFNEAYAARKKADKTPRDNFGMWIALDTVDRIHHDAVGGGIVEKYKPVARFSLEKLIAENAESLAGSPNDGEEFDARESADEPVPTFSTIAQVMAWARERVAEIAGVRVDAIKLDLKVEY